MAEGKILVVDDEQIVLTGLRRIFEDSGYYIKTALTGRDAIELVKQEHFDIVYTDMVMPGTNGAEICREIKKISPDTEVILFSGTATGVTQFWREFIAEGGTDKMLRKPLGKEEMISATEDILSEIRKKKAG
jgi:YesN/AraC family two-component response regulator